MRKTTLGALTARVVGGTDREGGGDGPVVVLLHGYGAPGTDLVPLWRALGAPPEMRFVFPMAPIVLDRWGGEDASPRAWWAIDTDEMIRAVATGDVAPLIEREPPGMLEAREKIEALLDAVTSELGAKPEQIVIGGFSQGAMLATETVLGTTRPFAGLVVLSGTLLAAPRWVAAMPARAGLPVLLSHGRSDPLLPFFVAETLRDRLRTAGLAVEWLEFQGGHTIPNAVVERLAAFASSAAQASGARSGGERGTTSFRSRQ